MPLIGAFRGLSPCLDCKDRWINETGRCHSSCEKYLTFKKEASDYNKRILEERDRQRKNPIRDIKTQSALNRIHDARKK